jgi:hypothetical protein
MTLQRVTVARRVVAAPRRSPARFAVALLTATLLAGCTGGDAPSAPIAALRTTTLPAAMQLVAGDAQSGFSDAPAPVAPSVRVVTAAGVPVSGAIVHFTPGTGSGTVSGGTVRTDANGVAAVGQWIFGPAATQTLVATTDSLPGRVITFRATVNTSRFSITVRFIGDGGTDRQREAFTKAAARWQRVIIGDIGTTPLNAPAGECTDWIPALNESVHNLLVFVRIAPIDGPARIVGQASPCYVNTTSKLPIMGFFELDADDLTLMADRGILDDVVLHEMGHILGIGTLWNYARSLLVGSGSDDPYFTGGEARRAFAAAGGAGYAGTPVPVENSGGSGTRDTHWRNAVFGKELMQGFAQAGGMPLSRITAASLQDLGYVVSLAAVDSYSLLTAAVQADASVGGTTPALALGHDIARAPLYEVSSSGGRRLVRPELE